jgi:hypothetical protein
MKMVSVTVKQWFKKTKRHGQQGIQRNSGLWWCVTASDPDKRIKDKSLNKPRKRRALLSKCTYGRK